MTKVFIGGSRMIKVLPSPVVARIDNIIENEFRIHIGDAYGIDNCVQKYLAGRRYENVTVFYSGDICRHNLGPWETRSVPSRANMKGAEFYALKDVQLAKESDYGFMIWDAKSSGTLNNIFNLLRERRNILVYFAPGQSFHTIRNDKDLSAFLHMRQESLSRP